jgi:hypothetical protein
MNDVVQQFETPIIGRDGERYVAYVRGRMREDGRWQASVEFRRVVDGVRFGTGTETTQPDWQAILYWATGLGTAYFQGALDRALRPERYRDGRNAQPVIDRGVDSLAVAERRGIIARAILDYFGRRGEPRVLTQELFDRLPFAGGDVVRALELLEKQERLLARVTDQGNDWVLLTEEGLRAAGLEERPHQHDVALVDRRKPQR